jgi:transposase
VEAQDFTTTIREHVRAFGYLEGAGATCLYDNMKVVVTGYDGDQPIYNTHFLAFATHYGFQPGPAGCTVPKRKAKWKNLYQRRSWLCTVSRLRGPIHGGFEVACFA